MSPGPLLLAAALSLLTSVLVSRRRPRVWTALVLGASAAGLAAVVAAFTADGSWEWQSAIPLCGELLHFRFDGISALFLALLAVVAGSGAVYARDYWHETAHPRSARTGRTWWSTMVLSMGLVLLSSNGLHFLLGWELFTVSAYFLITLDPQRQAVRAAGWLYLAASHVGTICLFAYFSLLAARTGSWELGPLQAAAGNRELAPLFWLALVGFGLKAGMFPLHIWLPSAHANAPSHVSALLSGVTIKLGIYGLVRFSGWMPVPFAAGWVIAALGVTSAVLGVAFALGQHDLKRLLAYHSVENIGIILIGLGFALVATADGHARWGQLALAGALLHVWNHGLFKSLLFLGAGSILHTTGTREMSQLGGLARAMPWTAALFALGAAAICGLPPLNGFVSEWLVFLGLFDAVLSRAQMTWLAIPAAILLGVTGALALACFVKVCGVVFLGAPRSPAAEHAHECSPAMRGPMVLLASCCVAIGLAPIAFWPAIARAVAVWQPARTPASAPVPLVTLGWCHLGLAVLALAAAVWLWRRIGRYGLRRALTWDCGYAFPTARMQYTAGSFAGIITEWFDWILRPQRHEHRPEETLPAHAAFAEHTPETVLEHVVHPVSTWVMSLSTVTRRLQHGHLQSYLLYIVIGIAGLAAIVASGSGQ